MYIDLNIQSKLSDTQSLPLKLFIQKHRTLQLITSANSRSVTLYDFIHSVRVSRAVILAWPLWNFSFCWVCLPRILNWKHLFIRPEAKLIHKFILRSTCNWFERHISWQRRTSEKEITLLNTQTFLIIRTRYNDHFLSTSNQINSTCNSCYSFALRWNAAKLNLVFVRSKLSM